LHFPGEAVRIVFVDRPELRGWRGWRNRFRPAAAALANGGHEVVLADSVVRDEGDEAECRHILLDPGPMPILTGLNREAPAEAMIWSHRVAHQLAELAPDLLIAPLRGGLARSVLMARQCGESYGATRIALWADTPSRSCFLGSESLATDIGPLVADALERQALSLADALILPAGQAGPDLAALAVPSMPRFEATLLPQPPESSNAGGPVNEIVFLGPMSRSAGVEALIEAIEQLAADGRLGARAVTFLGPIRSGVAGIGKEWLGLRATPWPFRFGVTAEEDWERARRYVAQPGRLAVLVARDHEDLQLLQGCGKHVVLLQGAGLAGRIAQALSAHPDGDRLGIAETRVDDWPDLVRQLAALPRIAAGTIGGGTTVCILHRDRLPQLAHAIASVPIRVDGYPVELLVIDNASRGAGVRRSIDALIAGREQARVIALDEPMPFAAAYNRGLAAARHDTVIFLDDDNAFAADGAARLARALAAGGFDVVVTTLDIFEDDGPAPGPCVAHTTFLGAAHSAGLFFNGFGDTAMAVRRDAFLSTGGFYDAGRAYPCADWATLARAQARGLRIGVLQWPAVRYRRNAARSDLMAQKLDQEGARAVVFAAYEGAYDAELVARYAQMLNLDVT
jgi:hypothetical protein